MAFGMHGSFLERRTVQRSCSDEVKPISDAAERDAANIHGQEMPKDPEEQAREHIDEALAQAGWAVQDRDDANLTAARGVAVREFRLRRGHGQADYLLFADGEALGAVEAKPEGTTLKGVERQSEKYSEGLPDGVPAPVQPLPFLYESTGVVTQFTNRLDPARQPAAPRRPRRLRPVL